MNPEEFTDGAHGQLVRIAGGHWAFIPRRLPPEIIWSDDLVRTLSAADMALGELAGLGHSLPNPHLLIRPFIRREAVLSSRIEGTQASLVDLYIYERERERPLPAASDAQEVYNYVKALDYGLTRLEQRPLGLRLIQEIHARLMEGVRGRYRMSGKFRNRQNWIGSPGATIESSTYVPPPVDEMHRLLDNLESYMNHPNGLPPLIRLGLVHYQFEAIHPFLDGNGRVGRLLISLLLCAWQLLHQPLLYLSEYFETERKAYYDYLLKVSQQGSWNDWLSYFLRGVHLQSRDAVLRIRRITDLRDVYRSTLQEASAPGRMLLALDHFFERPVLTVDDLSRELNVAYATANRYVDQLVELKILREMTGQARNRVFRAEDILSAIDDPLESIEELT